MTAVPAGAPAPEDPTRASALLGAAPPAPREVGWRSASRRGPPWPRGWLTARCRPVAATSSRGRRQDKRGGVGDRQRPSAAAFAPASSSRSRSRPVVTPGWPTCCRWRRRGCRHTRIQDPPLLVPWAVSFALLPAYLSYAEPGGAGPAHHRPGRSARWRLSWASWSTCSSAARPGRRQPSGPQPPAGGRAADRGEAAAPAGGGAGGPGRRRPGASPGSRRACVAARGPGLP